MYQKVSKIQRRKLLTPLREDPRVQVLHRETCTGRQRKKTDSSILYTSKWHRPRNKNHQESVLSAGGDLYVSPSPPWPFLQKAASLLASFGFSCLCLASPSTDLPYIPRSPAAFTYVDPLPSHGPVPCPHMSACVYLHMCVCVCQRGNHVGSTTVLALSADT